MLSQHILGVFSCDPSWTWGKLLDTHGSLRKHLCRNLPYQFQGDDIPRLQSLWRREYAWLSQLYQSQDFNICP